LILSILAETGTIPGTRAPCVRKREPQTRQSGSGEADQAATARQMPYPAKSRLYHLQIWPNFPSWGGRQTQGEQFAPRSPITVDRTQTHAPRLPCRKML